MKTLVEFQANPCCRRFAYQRDVFVVSYRRLPKLVSQTDSIRTVPPLGGGGAFRLYTCIELSRERTVSGQCPLGGGEGGLSDFTHVLSCHGNGQYPDSAPLGKGVFQTLHMY